MISVSVKCKKVQSVCQPGLLVVIQVTAFPRITEESTELWP